MIKIILCVSTIGTLFTLLAHNFCAKLSVVVTQKNNLIAQLRRANGEQMAHKNIFERVHFAGCNT